MIELVSMIGASWHGPKKAAIEALVVGIIATLATDLWLWLLQIVGVPPADWALVGRWVAWMPRGVFVHRPIAATPSIRGELAIGWGFHYVVGIAYAALYLAITFGARFRADAHLRIGVRARAPRCTVARHATCARSRVLRSGDAAPERNPHHQHFRACSFRRRSLFRGHLDQLPLS
jgi:hypothetical protein